MTKGIVLRQPRISQTSTASDPQTLVLSRDSIGLGFQDQDEYTSSILDASTYEGVEYLVVPYRTSNLVASSQFIQEESFALDDSSMRYGFNEEGFSLSDLSVTTSDVPDKIDPKGGVLEYDSIPASLPTVQYKYAPSLVNFTRNTKERTLFGYDDQKRRWRPLPGSSPELVGSVPQDPLEVLTLPIEEVGIPLIKVGGIEEPSLPLLRVNLEAQWSDYLQGVLVPVQGTGVIFGSDMILASDLVAGSSGLPVYHYRTSGFGFDTSTGLMTPIEGSLYLNPIPLPSESVLIRKNFGSYLTVSSLSNVQGDEDVVYDETTGKLTFSNLLEDSDRIYYDGLHSNSEPVPSYGPTSLGQVVVNASSTQGLNTIDSSLYDPSGLILYLEETGLNIQILHEVFEVDDLPKPSQISVKEAYFFHDKSTQEVQIQLSLAFMRKYEGLTLAVGTGDFYIEDGITFRAFPVEGEPDFLTRTLIQDEVLLDSIPQGPFARIPQIPLEDLAGYAQGVFFKRSSGGSQKTLNPGEDVVYDFESSQVRWASQENSTQYITRESSSVKLPHEVLLDSEASFELDLGQGLQPLTPGENIVVDYDVGSVAFAQSYGAKVASGIGEASSSSFQGEGFGDLVTPVSIVGGFKPLLVMRDSLEVRSILLQGTSLLLSTDLEVPRSAYDIYEYPQTVYKNAKQTLDLNARATYIYQTNEVPLDNFRGFIPQGESFELFEGMGSLSVQVLTPESLGAASGWLHVPTQYLHSEAVYTLTLGTQTLTKVSSNPFPGEYVLNGNRVELHVDDKVDKFKVILYPDFSSPRATGPVEYRQSDRQVQVPATVSTLWCETLVPQESYSVQAQSGQIFLEDLLIRGTLLRARYLNSNEEWIEEDVSFLTQEPLGFISGTSIAMFGDSLDVDIDSPTQVYENRSAISEATVDLSSKSVTLHRGAKPNRRYSIRYSVISARGGEQTFTLSSPVSSEGFKIRAGDVQSAQGDRTGQLDLDTIIFLEDRSFGVFSSDYDSASNTTHFTVHPKLDRDYTNPELTYVKINAGDNNLYDLKVENVSANSSKVHVYGNHVNLFPQGHLIYVSEDPYQISASAYDQDKGQTVVTLASRTLTSYSTPSLSVTLDSVYEEESPSVLRTGKEVFITEDVRLMKILEDGTGEAFRRGVDFEVSEGGDIVLDPTNIELPKPSETWLFSFLAKTSVGPEMTPQGLPVNPRLKSSYTRYITATKENFAGETLSGRYSFYAPQTFYFRTVPLDVLEEEVSETSTPKLITSFKTTSKSFEKGSRTSRGDFYHLKDQDRVARYKIQKIHTKVTGWENYLQFTQGLTVGDEDGPFRFYIADDMTPGGENPYTGDLIPYYTNPDGSGDTLSSTQLENLNLNSQNDLIRNSIDDLVVVSKNPSTFSFFAGYSFKGTYKQAWKPSNFSRFYPQSKTVVTLTPPDKDQDGVYEFLEDFRTSLGDLDQEDILNVESLSARSARARVISSELISTVMGVKILLGSSLSPQGIPVNTPEASLAQGNSEVQTPGFRVGDLVSMGRVSYTIDPTTNVTRRSVDIYAQHMLITDVSSDGITVDKVTQAYFNTAFPGFTLDSDLGATDPQTLGGILSADVGYTSSTKVVQALDTFYVTSTQEFLASRDYSFDASSGELKNIIQPSFIAAISGQRPPQPLTYLEASLVFKNQRTEPFEFPALSGKAVNDSGLQALPYRSPLLQSESVLLEQERNALLKVLLTSAGEVLTLHSFDSTTLYTTSDLTGVLSVQDTILLEDVVSVAPMTGNSSPFTISEVTANTLKVAVFSALESSVVYTLEGVFPGSGSGSGTVWTDSQARDFTVLQSLQGTLVVGSTSYPITGYGAGFVTVIGALPSTGAFSIEVQGIGDVISLNLFEDVGVNFTSWVTGTLLTISSGPNQNSYTINSGFQDTFEPVSIPLEFTSGIIAVKGTRRFSTELRELQDVWVRQRSLYSTQISQYAKVQTLLSAAPPSYSTPPSQALDSLLNETFTTTRVTGSDGTIQDLTQGLLKLDSAASSFTQDMVGSYVEFVGDLSSGFGKVSQVLSSTSIELESSGNFVNVYDTPTGQMAFELFGESDQDPRDIEFLLHERLSLRSMILRLDMGILSCIHDPNTFRRVAGLTETPGDPRDQNLNSHLTGDFTLLPIGNLSRRAWIDSVVQPEVEAILNSSQNLYAQRYAWIDYRINMQTGTLPRIKQLKETQAKTLRQKRTQGFRNG